MSDQRLFSEGRRLNKAYVDEIIVRKPGEVLSARMSLCHFIADAEDEIVETLHPEELRYYQSLKFTARKKSYLLGRYSAKLAFAALVNEVNLNEILIGRGYFGQPVTTYVHKPNVQVSITHCDDFGCALAFPESHPMAIDIEGIHAVKSETVETQITDRERRIIRTLPCSYREMLTLLWTVKESLSKILKTGLTTPLRIYEINKVEQASDFMVSYFENFGQYKSVSFRVGHCICSLTCPKSMDVNINLPALNQSIGLTEISAVCCNTGR